MGSNLKSARVKNAEGGFVQNFDSPWLGERVRQRISRFFVEKAYHFGFYALSNPVPLAFMRWLFSRVRAINPIWNIFGFCLLTRHDDVKEVLARMEDFSSADTMNKKTPAGPFVLSIDWRIHHDRELKILQDATFPFVDEDAQRITKLARSKANECLALACSHRNQKLNVAEDLTEEVALCIVEEYIGVSPAGDKNPQLRFWLRTLAAQIFTPPPAGSKMHMQTAQAASNLICYIHEIIADIKNHKTGTKPTKDDTLLVRLVRLAEARNGQYPWLDDNWVCALVAGMIVAGNATVTRAQTQAIYRILTLHGAPQLARETALRYHGNSQSADGKKAMLQIIYEALRFNPMLPVLSPRYCVRDTVIARTHARATKINAGTKVLPFVFAAMFDEKVFADPKQFKTGRDLETYLHFGWGPHMCFGKFVADIQFIETAAALFGNREFTVEVKAKAKILYEGPAAIHYPVLLRSAK